MNYRAMRRSLGSRHGRRAYTKLHTRRKSKRDGLRPSPASRMRALIREAQ